MATKKAEQMNVDNERWGSYFDLRKEAMRLRHDCASGLTTLDAVMHAFGRALAVAAVLAKMIAQGNAPSQRPQQIPHGDMTGMRPLDRQWHSSPVSRNHIAHQQQAAQQKAAHAIGFAANFTSEAEAAAAAGRDKQFMGERYIEVFPATLQDMRYCLAQSNPSTAGSTIGATGAM
eukprot:gene42167-24234_t